MERQGVRATLFADVCSAIQYRKCGIRDGYPALFDDQLRKFASAGNDIQLHIHSNWLKSGLENGEMKISPKGYRIHDYGFNAKDPNSAMAILRDGKAYLENLLLPVDPEYRCVAYRAGGFVIEPEEELFRELVRLGIRIDSSVALYQMSPGCYDYMSIPDCLNWWMAPQTGFRSPVGRGKDTIYEVSIGAARNSVFKFAGIQPKDLRVKSRVGAGSFVKNEDAKREKKAVELLRIMKRRLFGLGILSLDTRGYKVLMRDIEEIYCRYGCKEQDAYTAIICHPKLASKDTVMNLENFVASVKLRSEKFDFITMRDIVDRMEL